MTEDNSAWSISERLSRLVCRFDAASVPAPTMAAARAHLLDGLGITIGGASTSIGGVARRYLDLSGRARSPSVLLPPPGQHATTAEEDAFLWGSYAFSENYGDTSLRSVAHPNTVIVPAALAGARDRPVTGQRLLAGVLVGYQVMEFLARSLNNGRPRMAHQIRGFRPTATCGAAGTAATLAYLWKLDEGTTQRAIELACNFGGGLRRHGSGTESSIRIHSGEVTRGGVTAVLLSLAGLEGERHLVEGDGGFFAAYRAGELDGSASTYLPPPDGSSVPERWAIDDVAFKFHCTPHTLATALDCILDVLAEDKVLAGDVTAVEVAVPDQHVTISASEAYQPPDNPSAAAASYPFCCGAVLATGDFIWPETLGGRLREDAVLRIARTVRVVASATQSERFEADSGTWPAAVTLAAGGERFRAERAEPFGASFNGAVGLQVERKFRRMAERALSPSAAADLVDAVARIEDLADAYGTLSTITG